MDQLKKLIAIGTLLLCFVLSGYLSFNVLITLINDFSIYTLLLNLLPIGAFVFSIYGLFKIVVLKVDDKVMTRALNGAVAFFAIIVLMIGMFNIIHNKSNDFDYFKDYILPHIFYFIAFISFTISTSMKKELLCNIFGAFSSLLTLVGYFYINWEYFSFNFSSIMYILIFLGALGYNTFSLLLRFMFGSEE